MWTLQTKLHLVYNSWDYHNHCPYSSLFDFLVRTMYSICITISTSKVHLTYCEASSEIECTIHNLIHIKRNNIGIWRKTENLYIKLYWYQQKINPYIEIFKHTFMLPSSRENNQHQHTDTCAKICEEKKGRQLQQDYNTFAQCYKRMDISQ